MERRGSSPFSLPTGPLFAFTGSVLLIPAHDEIDERKKTSENDERERQASEQLVE